MHHHFEESQYTERAGPQEGITGRRGEGRYGLSEVPYLLSSAAM